MRNEHEIIELLKGEFHPTPCESKVYISLMKHGPMMPIELTQKARIPRPRTYAVLKSLVGKGLVMEHLGNTCFCHNSQEWCGRRDLNPGRRLGKPRS